MVDGQILYQNRFVALVERDHYTFLHEIRSDGRLIVIVPFRMENGAIQWLARVEICPAHSMTPKRCAITGGVDPDETILQAAQNELYEEAGYRVSAEALIDLGFVYPSKSADTIATLYSVDLTGQTAETPPSDGSHWEQGTGVDWVDQTEALAITDALFLATWARLQFRTR
ncbi:MAG: NUDIX hydrolase [Anaerolineae bacterium]|jgi:8-oxo-dGTP pyrophosphatase MutT (NUDIX family)|nr:NUDIX hydrolase [Anaerolineae bacterium]